MTAQLPTQRANPPVRGSPCRTRAATYVNTIRGLWATLELGVERGGLAPDVRHAIYKAGHEQFDLYDKEMGGDGWH